jgi:hypothetical protein
MLVMCVDACDRGMFFSNAGIYATLMVMSDAGMSRLFNAFFLVMSGDGRVLGWKPVASTGLDTRESSDPGSALQ